MTGTAANRRAFGLLLHRSEQWTSQVFGMTAVACVIDMATDIVAAGCLVIGLLAVCLVVGTLSSLHRTRWCSYCFDDIPSDPAGACEHHQVALQLHHTQAASLALATAFPVLMVSIFAGWLWVSAAVLVTALALESVSSRSRWIHRVLQPWCPWCDNNGWDDDDPNVDPVDPTAAQRKTDGH